MSEVNHRGYVIYNDGTFGMKLIKSTKAGVLPKELRGSFTKASDAIKAIDRVVSRKEENGKDKSAN